MTGFGTSSYGLGPWGAPGGLSIVSARALSPRAVLVVLSGYPQETSALLAGDALNPFTWRVLRAGAATSFTVASVRRRALREYVLALVEALGPSRVTHTVSSTTLRSSTGALITTPTSATFPGIDSDETRNAANPNAFTDVRNPATPAKDGARAGSLRVGANGDYQRHEGPELARKLLLRRLSTFKGDFPHLPNYGLGLRAKELFTAGRLPELRAEIERQCSAEPGVEGVVATLALKQDGQLRVSISARFGGASIDAATTLEAPNG